MKLLPSDRRYGSGLLAVAAVRPFEDKLALIQIQILFAGFATQLTRQHDQENNNQVG